MIPVEIPWNEHLLACFISRFPTLIIHENSPFSDKALTVRVFVQIAGKIKFSEAIFYFNVNAVIPNSLQVSIIIPCIMQVKG